MGFNIKYSVSVEMDGRNVYAVALFNGPSRVYVLNDGFIQDMKHDEYIHKGAAYEEDFMKL